MTPETKQVVGLAILVVGLIVFVTGTVIAQRQASARADRWEALAGEAKATADRWERIATEALKEAERRDEAIQHAEFLSRELSELQRKRAEARP